MGTQIVHTICMQTNDAIQKQEGEFVMQLGGDNPRFNAVKLALGSLEFPMVQWTIEKEWNMIYFSEGYRLTHESSWLKIEEKTNKQSNVIQCHIPLYLNGITSIKVVGEFLSIRTEYPHGLWVEGKRCIIPYIYWGEVSIICGCAGGISLKHLYDSEELEYLSENEFMIPNVNKEKIDNENYGYLYMPTIPSPNALCNLLTFSLNYTKSLGSYSVDYNSVENVANLQSSLYPEDCDYLRIKLFGNDLAKLLGYMSDEHTSSFYHKKHTNTLSIMPSIRFELPDETDPPLILKSEQFPGWMSVNVMPGWYAPSNRPMCTGQPLRINQEFETAFNRLYFPIPEKIPRGHATSHFIVFCDPTGMQHLCPIYSGRYNPETFCSYVEDEMTRLAKRTLKDVYFSVNYDFSTKLYTFTCERRIRETIVPSPFSLIFNHPASIDSLRLGFPPVHLKGCDSYTSSDEVVIPNMKWSNGRYHCNTYRISEISYQKRFMIESSPTSQLIGIVRGFDETSSEAIVQTYIGQLPYAHGLQQNDTISIMPTSSTELFIMGENGWEMKEFEPCPIAPAFGKSGIIQELGKVLNASSSYNKNCLLRIKLHAFQDLGAFMGKIVSIVTDVEPYHLCFGTLPRSLPSKMLGFGKGAIQYEKDGSIISGSLKIAPFIAKAVHCLDHPDYILLYFEEGKKNMSLQHTSGNNSTAPFAKLVLYPIFREERMLPRDTTLLGSELFSKFTLKFRNPDGTPYHFHNADFSFSLNFIKVNE